MIGQVVTGKLYDEKTTAKSVKILNTSSKIITYSDNNGDFTMTANIGDSLVFSSVFYNEKILILNENHFNRTVVVQLKKIINELDEVLLAEKPKFIPFKPEKHQADFNTQLANDRKNRPYLYNTYRSGGIDFIAVANLIGKLFKKKRPDPIQYVTYKELDSFFNKNDYFNSKLLHEELRIIEAYRFLYFDYCEARNINKKMLSGNKLVLLDTFMTYSSEFLKILEAYKE